MGSINAIPEYQEHYNLGAGGATSTGLVFSIYQIGQMVGALFIWVCDWRGRKVPIFVGCFGVVVASVITAVAPNRECAPATIGQRQTLTPGSQHFHRRPLPVEFLCDDCHCRSHIISC